MIIELSKSDIKRTRDGKAMYSLFIYLSDIKSNDPDLHALEWLYSTEFPAEYGVYFRQLGPSQYVFSPIAGFYLFACRVELGHIPARKLLERHI